MLPEKIVSAEQLDDLLSAPSREVINAVNDFNGDIMILGAGGKIGPTLTRMLQRAVEMGNDNKKIYAVARRPLDQLNKKGITTITCDLMDPEQVADLPQARNIFYLIGRKFGSTGSEHLTWGINTIAAHNTRRFFLLHELPLFQPMHLPASRT